MPIQQAARRDALTSPARRLEQGLGPTGPSPCSVGTLFTHTTGSQSEIVYFYVTFGVEDHQVLIDGEILG